MSDLQEYIELAKHKKWKADLEEYLAAARVRTRSEIEDEAAKFVANSGLNKEKKIMVIVDIVGK
jgi:hypothetical protein